MDNTIETPISSADPTPPPSVEERLVDEFQGVDQGSAATALKEALPKREAWSVDEKPLIVRKYSAEEGRKFEGATREQALRMASKDLSDQHGAEVLSEWIGVPVKASEYAEFQDKVDSGELGVVRDPRIPAHMSKPNREREVGLTFNGQRLARLSELEDSGQPIISSRNGQIQANVVTADQRGGRLAAAADRLRQDEEAVAELQRHAEFREQQNREDAQRRAQLQAAQPRQQQTQRTQQPAAQVTNAQVAQERAAAQQHEYWNNLSQAERDFATQNRAAVEFENGCHAWAQQNFTPQEIQNPALIQGVQRQQAWAHVENQMAQAQAIAQDTNVSFHHTRMAREHFQGQLIEGHKALRKQWVRGEDAKVTAYARSIGLEPGSPLFKSVNQETQRILDENPDIQRDWDNMGDSRAFSCRKVVIEAALYRLSQRNATAIRSKIDRYNTRPPVSAMRPTFGGAASAPQGSQGDLRGRIRAAENDLARATTQRESLRLAGELTRLKRAAGELRA
jgi:hypothetical protein